MFLHDALLLPLLGLLAQALLLSLAHLLEFSLALLQLLLLALDVQALQTLLALFDGLAASQDALVLFTSIFQEGSGALLTLLLPFLLQEEDLTITAVQEGMNEIEMWIR